MRLCDFLALVPPWLFASACLSVLELSQTIAMILTSACLSVLEFSRTIATDPLLRRWRQRVFFK